MEEPCRVVGYDLLNSNKKLLDTGFIDFLINTQPNKQAYKSLECLYRYLVLKEKPERNITMPLDIVTKEKLSYY
ncbi:type 1 periplasmic-binding domain-containing protein [Galbibacter mesophilus]|uniref:hypothetical protein n=1 Tax=Galbibacter mesophilus TaxID=379069 RepID=UPI00191EA64B|nr:hypothetical protein [Galbibacter mesophilus]MCM5664027.1 hypothetical protein [Galbibacter mesophilus]